MSNQLLEKGSLVFIRPKDIHCYRSFNYYSFKMLNVGFLIEDIIPVLRYLNIPQSLIDASDLPVHIKADEDTLNYLSARLKKLASMFPSRKCGPFFKSFASSIFYLLIENKEYTINPNNWQIPRWMIDLDFKMSIRENYIKGTDKLYSLCNYSQSHIIRSFKKYFKMTPTEYVNTKRMTYVCDLLIAGDNSISDICYMAGFNNLSYFYTVFHSLYNCTPKDFLKKQHTL